MDITDGTRARKAGKAFATAHKKKKPKAAHTAWAFVAAARAGHTDTTAMLARQFAAAAVKVYGARRREAFYDAAQVIIRARNIRVLTAAVSLKLVPITYLALHAVAESFPQGLAAISAAATAAPRKTATVSTPKPRPDALCKTPAYMIVNAKPETLGVALRHLRQHAPERADEVARALHKTRLCAGSVCEVIDAQWPLSAYLTRAGALRLGVPENDWPDTDISALVNVLSTCGMTIGHLFETWDHKTRFTVHVANTGIAAAGSDGPLAAMYIAVVLGDIRGVQYTVEKLGVKPYHSHFRLAMMAGDAAVVGALARAPATYPAEALYDALSIDDAKGDSAFAFTMEFATATLRAPTEAFVAMTGRVEPAVAMFRAAFDVTAELKNAERVGIASRALAIQRFVDPALPPK